MLKIEPQEPGKGFEFVDAIKGGVVPREFIPAVEKGLAHAAQRRARRLPGGRRQGHAVRRLVPRRRLVENAFKMAASIGFKDGCRKGQPGHPEPMMAVEVDAGRLYAGDVIGDLSSRRGMVQGMDDMPGGGKIIKAEVPLPRCSATRRRCAR